MGTFTYEKIDFSQMNFETSIEEFFSKEEYANMCDMEKLRFKNLRLNYEMMLQFGLPAVKPDFMKPRWGIPKQTADTFSDKESDEEWRPRPKRKRAPKPWRPPLRTPSATVTSASACSGFTAHQASTSGVRKTRKKTEKPKEEPRVYSFRKRKDVNYMKLEVPNDDEFIYCEECDQEFQGDCPEHGPFHVVDDTPVPSQKRADPQRALKTLPPGLEVRESGIPDAGLGVFATQFFPTRSRFGPYQGRHVTDPDIAHSSGYCWQICTDEGYSYFVDAKDCKTANWMRYVNCARTRAEQNVTAFQHCGEVYYRAHCDIQPGTEILVWYGREYGKELGIIREDDELKSKRRSSTVQPESDSERLTDDQMNFSDIRTSDIEFSDSSEEEDCNNRKRKTPKKQVNLLSSDINKTTQLSVSGANRTPLHKSANTSGSLLSLNRSHMCQRCSAAFVLFSSLKLHMMHVHGEKLHAVLPVSSTPGGCDAGNYSNKNVGKVTDLDDRKVVQRKNNKAGDNTDKESEKKSRRHVCDVCSKAFSHGGHLKTHRLIHTGHKQFVCDVCSKAFTQAGTLKRHRLIHTGHKQFVCDVCSKAFTQAGNLKRHRRIHTGEKPYMCPHCDAGFNSSSHLQRHIRSAHAGDRPYVCDVCGAAFSQTGTLKTHKRTHTGEKPYTCDVCGAAFSETGTLKKHKRTHTGEKPHVCTDCGKGFAHSSDLKHHQLTHTGEKPHTCPHCPAAFTQSRDLKKHTQKVHQ